LESKHDDKVILRYIKNGNTVKEASKQFKMPEEEIKRICVLDEIKNGKSLKQTAKKYNVWISTVAYWCKLAGIKSKHTRAESKATDKQMLDAIKKNKVMTVAELENTFGYKTNAARRRLRRLVESGKLNYVVIGGGGKASSLFKDFIDKRLYYISQEDLTKWVKNKIPKYIPGPLKNAITQKLHDIGIDIEFKSEKKKAIMVEPKLYKQIKEKATKEGITIAQYVDKVAKGNKKCL